MNNQKCSICKQKEAIYYRCIKEYHYFLCNSEECNNISQANAGILKPRDLQYSFKDKGDTQNAT